MTTVSGTARMLLAAGHLVGLAAAALVIALMAGQGYGSLLYAISSEASTRGEVGGLPFVYVLRAILRLRGRASMRVLLAAFGASSLLLYGWYFLLLGMDDVFLY
ncbi:MAG: hypothetical protein AVDCRST_MAG22-1285 [uncultured Rubrobacteraceae bacterium]|uniref:Uncharacterized protein n=1 Tax=uncultured Rubrobacteraceae bacterium TaxID=349277 RepID=A0A6J4P274_9ACTN|nr:MAG: hypothetical protein AVDCRST_MAG22-1285 [uncultured Rubrobacteraceae bacterium]